MLDISNSKCLAAKIDSPLSHGTALCPNCLSKCLPNCLSPTREGFFPGEGNCAVTERQKLSRGNFCLAAFRCLSRPSGSLTTDTITSPSCFSRAFLNLWFAKPMVCMWAAFHENEGNHENDENDEDNSDSCKQAIECWIREMTGTTGMTKTTAIRGANHRFPKQRV